MLLWQTPAIVIAVLLWLQSPPTSLADAAQREAIRRTLMPKATRSLTNMDVDRVPPRPMPVVALPVPDITTAAPTAAAPGSPAKPGEAHDEDWWHTRITTARLTLDHDRLLADALQSRINALTNDWSARDDPAQRQQLWDERERTMAEAKSLQDQLVADQKAIDDLQDEARRQDVPAGWIR